MSRLIISCSLKLLNNGFSVFRIIHLASNIMRCSSMDSAFHNLIATLIFHEIKATDSLALMPRCEKKCGLNGVTPSIKIVIGIMYINQIDNKRFNCSDAISYHTNKTLNPTNLCMPNWTFGYRLEKLLTWAIDTSVFKSVPLNINGVTTYLYRVNQKRLCRKFKTKIAHRK